MPDEDGIGPAGTEPVRPSNPLYDAVESGGGFVVDEDTGDVTGGPDGDGTARTDEERLNRPNNAMGDSSGGGGGGGGRPRPQSPSVNVDARSAADQVDAATAGDLTQRERELVNRAGVENVEIAETPDTADLVDSSASVDDIPAADTRTTPNKSTQAPRNQPRTNGSGGGGGSGSGGGGGGGDPFGTPSPAPSSNSGSGGADDGIGDTVVDAAGDAARFAFGGEEGAFGEANISPSARMSLDEPDAVEARAQKEQDILDQRSADDLGDVPGATAANLFGLGQRVEQAGVAGGEAISDAVPSAEVGPEFGDETLGEVPSNIAGGGVAFAGIGVGAALQFPASAADDVDTQLSGDQTPIEAQGGNIDTAATFGETQATMATQQPVSTAAGFFVPGVSGTAGSLRGFRATRGTSGRVDFADITSSQGADGDLPNFRTSPDAPTQRAVDEIETRGGDQPDAINDISGGEDVLFHSTSEPFGRGDFEVGEGASELPGLFTAPDASPLGLSDFGQSRSGTSIGFSDLSTQPEAVPGFVPRGVEGLPEGTGTGGYAVRGPDGDLIETGLSRSEANRIADETGGERATDPTTAGFEFLSDDAPTETGLVRPQGERTTELEAILAPESQFSQQGAVAVDLPDGRTARTDIFGPVDEAGRAGEADSDIAAAEAGDGGPTRTASDISATSGRRSTQPDVAVDATASAFGGVGSGAGAGATDPLFGGFGPVDDGSRTGSTDEPPRDTTLGGGSGSPGFTDPGGVFGGTLTGGSEPQSPTLGPSGGTSAPADSSRPPGGAGGPPESVPGSPGVGVSEPSSGGTGGAGSSPTASDGSPFGIGMRSDGTGRRRRRDDDPAGRQDRPAAAVDDRTAASPEFSNPIAGVFEGFDFGQADGEQDLGPFG